MPPTPRNVAVCLILLSGIAGWLCAQTPPALTPAGSLYYLKQRVGVKNKFGVIGLNPGTGVHLISDIGNTCRVSDGTNTFEVSKDQLTGNVNEATLITQNYYATEQAGAEAFNSEVVCDSRFRCVLATIEKNSDVESTFEVTFTGLLFNEMVSVTSLRSKRPIPLKPSAVPKPCETTSTSNPALRLKAR